MDKRKSAKTSAANAGTKASNIKNLRRALCLPQVWVYATKKMSAINARTMPRKRKESERGLRPDSVWWYAWCDSNARPSESESDTLSSWATGAYQSIIYCNRSIVKKQGSFVKKNSLRHYLPTERREGIFEDYIIAYLGRIVKREFHQRICAIFSVNI